MSITAVILCGGKGMRLQSVIGNTPKCLALVAGRPFLTYILDHLVRQRVDKIVLSCGPYEVAIRMALDELPHAVVKTFGDRSWFADTPLDYSKDAQRGTWNAVKDAMPEVGDGGWVLLLNGDTYCPVRVGPLLQEHHDFGWELTTINSRNDGQVVIGKRRYSEYTGVSLYSAEPLCEALKQHEVGTAEMLHDYFSFRGTLNEKVVGWPFHDIGTPEGYAAAEGFLKSCGVIS